MAAEDRKPETEADYVAYKTKVVQFLGRSTPIVLQNENGPCPLLAICNVLLLRNSIHLSQDAPEVSLQKLLSLVAEKLIDSNNSVQGKDDVYLINQQQNIADAIDLLSSLATGIDVNVQFRKVNDFEFTRECAIFDLLDIGLYHGWIVDPQMSLSPILVYMVAFFEQDEEETLGLAVHTLFDAIRPPFDLDTAAAIGSKSYNALAGELVAFEAGKLDVENKKLADTDSVDFAAATTAALGVPSPSLSRNMSFDYCHEPLEVNQRKGDREEEAVLMSALNLSKTEVSFAASDPIVIVPHSIEGTTTFDVSALANSTCLNVQHTANDIKSSDYSDKIVPLECNTSSNCMDAHITAIDNNSDEDFSLNSRYSSISNGQTSDANQVSTIWSAESCGSYGSAYKEGVSPSGDEKLPFLTSVEGLLPSKQNKTDEDDETRCNAAVLNDSSTQLPNLEFQADRSDHLDVSSLTISEPIYEGEERILDSSIPAYGDPEPVYEGEMVLAEQASIAGDDAGSIPSNDQVTERQCQLIKNFLEGTANQLTIYGLFCLQEGLKERELCVFFRNNHFSTMFKFNGELYLLVTDQGYMNQPDLVWEKLNEVNGDTVFMTGNFVQFKAADQVNDTWNEQSAITSTADYLATLDGSLPSNSSFNSDLQLAIALQQQEFDHQPQQQQTQEQPQPHPHPPSMPQSSGSGRSRLVTGPQVSRNPNQPQKKDKCRLM